MNAKMKSCFTPHVMMHSLFGLGLGIVLTNLFTGTLSTWVGVGVMVVALVLDTMRKE